MQHSPTALLARMRSIDPASPRLVWHGAEGRIELSGRVFDNWVSKSSNLLVDELDAVEGTEVLLDLPVHWKTLVLALACWQIGAVVVLTDAAGQGGAGRPADAGSEQIVVSSATDPGVVPPQVLVCVALGSLASRWDGPLPRGALDFAAEVRSQDDVFPDPVSDAAASGAPVVRAGGGTLTIEELLHQVSLPDDVDGVGGRPPTILVEPGTPLVRALAAAYAVWLRGGTLVLVEDGQDVSDRLLSGERITGRL